MSQVRANVSQMMVAPTGRWEEGHKEGSVDGVCSPLMHRSCLDGPDVLSPPQGGGHTNPFLRLPLARRKTPH